MPPSPTREELQVLAGMPYGRDLEQAELMVRIALARHRDAQARARSANPSRFDLTPAQTRKWLRGRIAHLRKLKAKIVAEYGRYLPAIRRGMAAAEVAKPAARAA